jgi:hypothetical protein
MSNEGLTSVAVVDNAMNVIGNISTADVRLLTTSKALPLFHASCIHFISVILSERGIGDGKDSFPGRPLIWFQQTQINSCSVLRQSILHLSPYRGKTCCN